ncbi:lymphatic vessel endothelial hyaluronic receptor 1b isoform X1 [Syngnathoides biaculeatus]|uniref:lymphatic vessel endothelial hyaluronic receptor 1b isoform X1 n=1 Tax=Syngnathoides biaculeatus TaxID=300417 RepID=UPI002ADE8BB0|nr:lymphatic vessel endothelial hyaluronic receptor 1b isoform X1 [Syngnathoides biaculeatus]
MPERHQGLPAHRRGRLHHQLCRRARRLPIVSRHSGDHCQCGGGAATWPRNLQVWLGSRAGGCHPATYGAQQMRQQQNGTGEVVRQGGPGFWRLLLFCDRVGTFFPMLVAVTLLWFWSTSTALPQLSSWPTTSSSASSTTTPDPPPLPSSTPAPTSAFTKTTKAPPTWTPTPAAITTSSPPLPHRASSSTGDPLPSRAVTSSPAPAASSSSSSPSSSSTSASGSASTQQTPRPTDASMQVWRALIILKLGVGFVIATAAGVLCTYYKLKKGPFSSWAKHVDDVEVEMCKPTYSRTDLHHPLGDDDWDLEAQEEDARDRKYSSEIFLRVNPHLRSSNKMS